MRIVKIVLWIICITAVQTVFGKCFGILGTMPDLILAFSVIFALCEYDIFASGVVLLVCGIIDASSVGHLFPAALLGVVCAGLLSRGANGVLRYITGFIKALFITAGAAFAIGTAEYFAGHLTMSVKCIIENILPYTAYTVIGGCIIYPPVKHTLFPRKDKSLMIV
ncbi:MAG: hypothetical protein ACI4DP_11740 [Candidatus Ornithomonoglobus sp.]